MSRVVGALGTLRKDSIANAIYLVVLKVGV